MAYGWGEHVGELVLWVQAETEEGVFAEALRGLGELLADEEPDGQAPSEWRAVGARGDDRPRLFAAWLEELAFLAETEGFVPASVVELALEPRAVRARVGGHRGAPPHLVKAVTLHDLRFEPAAGGWQARALLDV